MPIFVLHTNLGSDKIPEKTVEDTASFLSGLFGKDVDRVRVRLHPHQLMAIGGSEDPCCMATYASVAKYSEAQSGDYSSKITDFISEKLKIPSPRVFVQFYEVPADMIARDGQLFSG